MLRLVICLDSLNQPGRGEIVATQRSRANGRCARADEIHEALPVCAEEIQDAAIKCRYCGSLLGDADSPAAAPLLPAHPRRLLFRSVTESDARLIPEGSSIELAAGGRISPRAEAVLKEKGVSVVRLTDADAIMPADVPEIPKSSPDVAHGCRS